MRRPTVDLDDLLDKLERGAVDLLVADEARRRHLDRMTQYRSIATKVEG